MVLPEDIRLDWIQFLFPCHTVYQHFLGPEHVGHFGVARMRSFMYIVHKQEAVYLVDLYQLAEKISDAICRRVRTRPSDYLTASTTARQVDEMLWCNSRKITYNAVPGLPCNLVAACVLFLISDHNHSHACHINKDYGGNVLYILNPRERQLVYDLDCEYRRLYRAEPVHDCDLVYYLGDSPSFSKTWSAASGRIPTYRRNQGKYLFRRHMRVMTGTDKLASLGWPVNESLAQELGTTVLPSLDARRSHLLAGNSMHLSVASLALLLGLVCFAKAEHG